MNFSENSGKILENLSKYGAFLTVGDEKNENPMTIGWGQIGISQGIAVFSVMVRQSRYSKELIDKNPYFTVSIPYDDSYKKALAFCGSKSGRDFDKIKECDLSMVKSDFINVSGVDGTIILECEVIYKSEMTKEKTNGECNEKWYKNGDYHTIYTGKILNCKEK